MNHKEHYILFLNSSCQDSFRNLIQALRRSHKRMPFTVGIQKGKSEVVDTLPTVFCKVCEADDM